MLHGFDQIVEQFLQIYIILLKKRSNTVILWDMRPSIEKIIPDALSSFHCHRREDSSFDFLWHFHEEVELTLITSSQGRRFVGDHIGDYESGDLVLVGSNLPHTWQSSKERSLAPHGAVVVQFKKDFLGKSFTMSPEFQPMDHLLKRSQRGLLFSGEEAERAERLILELPDLSGMDRLIRLLEVFSNLTRCQGIQPLAGAHYLPALAMRDSHRINRLADLFDKHLHEPITQARAASLAHMSPSTFSRFFKRVTGRTFIETLNEMRVSRACRLLRDSDLSVTEICYQCGFESLSYFNRRFKRSKKMSARQYRREFKTPDQT